MAQYEDQTHSQEQQKPEQNIWSLIPERELEANSDLAEIVSTHQIIQESINRSREFVPYPIYAASRGVFGDVRALGIPDLHSRRGGDPRAILGEARGMFLGYDEYPLVFVSYGMAREMVKARGGRAIIGAMGQFGEAQFVEIGESWGKFLASLECEETRPADLLLNIYALASGYHATKHSGYFHIMDGDQYPHKDIDVLHDIEDELRAFEGLFSILDTEDERVIYHSGPQKMNISADPLEKILDLYLIESKVRNPLLGRYLKFALAVKILRRFKSGEYINRDGEISRLLENVKFAINSLRELGVPDETFASDALLTGSQKIYQ